MVVLTSLWPSSSCTVRMSVPACSKCVAKKWRRVCTDTGLTIPANAIQLSPKVSDLIFGEYGRNTLGLLRTADVVKPRQVNIQHLEVQKQQSAERLVMGGGRHEVAIEYLYGYN